MRDVTLKQLKAVSAIGRTRRIVSAAKELNLTPPAVTLQLQQLETEAGLPLFDRCSDGLRPTDAGHVVMETAAEIWSLLAACQDRLAALKGHEAGHVSVGVVSTAKYFAPRLIAAFARIHAGIEVGLRVGNRDDIVAQLRDYAIDIAIMGTPPRDVPLDATEIGDHPLVIVAPPEHRLAGIAGLPKSALANEAFLMREIGSGTRHAMELYLDAVPTRASGVRIEMGSNETIKQAAMAGLGIAFISAHTVAAELEAGRLVTLDVEGMPVWRKWFVARRADKILTPAVSLFADFALAETGRYLPPYAGPEKAAMEAVHAGGRARPTVAAG